MSPLRDPAGTLVPSNCLLDASLPKLPRWRMATKPGQGHRNKLSKIPIVAKFGVPPLPQVSYAAHQTAGSGSGMTSKARLCNDLFHRPSDVNGCIRQAYKHSSIAALSPSEEAALRALTGCRPLVKAIMPVRCHFSRASTQGRVHDMNQGATGNNSA